ncbi:hypothetical protein GCM10010303_86260 [Streptomyces purpurascens]|nr:hypothetical protein GCM10010303_86260 [Streptomyces purpurascens]
MRGGGVLAIDLHDRFVTDHVVVEGVGVAAHGRADAGEVDPDALPGVGLGLDGLLDLGCRIPEEGRRDRQHQLLRGGSQAVTGTEGLLPETLRLLRDARG